MPIQPELSQLRKSVLQSKKYTAEKTTELAQAVTDALQEQTAQAFSQSLAVSDWQQDNGTYPYYQDIAIEKITANDRADIIILPDSIPAAQACAFCPVTETFNGKVRVRAASVPAKIINLIIWM